MSAVPEAQPTRRLDPDALRRALPALGCPGLRDADLTGLGAPPRGRVLKLRLGMNPNSSSVGTNVVVFMWSFAASAAVLSVAAAYLAARFAGVDPAEPGPDEQNPQTR